MTTATTVAGRPLSGWSRAARCGTWHALLPIPGRPDDPVLGALRIDRALLAPEGARERLTAAVLAVARLRLPGALGTVDLVAEAGEVWLITARPPVPTLADVRAADAPGPDAGSVASVLNETAQTLVALHAAGLAHGSLTENSVVLAPDGMALLAEAALGTALDDDMPMASTRRADIVAWAALARTLGSVWAPPGTPAADLFLRCSRIADSDGLAAARAALVAGRAALPENFLQRTALRAAAAAATPDPWTPQDPPPTVDDTPAAADRPGTSSAAPVKDRVNDTAVAADLLGTSSAPPDEDPVDYKPAAADRPGTPSAPPDEDPADDRPMAADPPGTPSSAPVGEPADDQPTVLGKRNRTPGPHRIPVAGADGDRDCDILLRFGPGVPTDEQDALRALWRPTGPVPAPRRRRRLWAGTTVILTAVAIVLWLALLRPDAGPTVTAAEVRAPAGELHCGQTADVIGVLTTDGRGGPVTYRWLRGDGQDSGELTRTAGRGETRVTVHLRWTVSGPGRFQGTARLQVLGRPTTPVEAEGSFTYSCP